ncbi:transporter substrate-binding domain-containing protein [Gottschalkiaceae bacterium SANA]|nr:transporter substrate-binding domain-containing protein [Gottschalkiaceae bacterium SANA]
MKNKRIILLILFISLALGASGCAKDETELVVGMELAYPPFETTDPEGNPMGISVDLAYALGEYLDRPVRIENTAWGGLIPALQSGKIDMVLSSMTIRPDRLEQIDFSDPYADAYLALLINQDSPVQLAEDLNHADRILAVKNGTTGHLVAMDLFPKATINAFDNENACVLEVSQGKADAFIYDQLTIYKNWKLNETTTRPLLEPFQDTPEQWGIGIKKGNDELKNQINAFLRDFKSSGGFSKLQETHLSEQKILFDELGVPLFF